MKKRGFTLIELLAVIIILAILMIIAVPNILSTLATAREQAFLSQAKSIYKTAEQQFVLDSMTGLGNTCYDKSNLDMGSISDTVSFVVSVDEEDGSINNIEIIDTGQGLKASGKDINGISLKTYTEATISCSGYSTPYTETLLHGADPVLGTGLVPVKISSTGSSWTVTKADTTKRWYKYGKSEWANAVILIDNPTHDANNDGIYEVGEVIHHDDIKGYFVWIPKYKYKLFDMGDYSSLTSNTTANQLIEIQFGTENTADGDSSCATPMNAGASGNCAVGKYMTHPSFISLNKNGYWVGKFETTGSISALTVLPGVNSILSQTVSAMFTNAYNYNRTLDSHMMKNTEWGAVAYLGNSNYGIGNTPIWENNNSNYVTGCTGDQEIDDAVASCENAWYTTTGKKGSVTGNITGVYDMSGGAWEYMASYRAETFGSSGFTAEQIAGYNAKYFDVYPNDTTVNTFNKRILGDATGEMGPINSSRYSSWYDDYSYFVDSSSPWFIRGGRADYGVIAGSFVFSCGTGGATSTRGFRLVLSP